MDEQGDAEGHDPESSEQGVDAAPAHVEQQGGHGHGQDQDRPRGRESQDGDGEPEGHERTAEQRPVGDVGGAEADVVSQGGHG